jgi:hypothetical protein
LSKFPFASHIFDGFRRIGTSNIACLGRGLYYRCRSLAAEGGGKEIHGNITCQLRSGTGNPEHKQEKEAYQGKEYKKGLRRVDSGRFVF